MSPCGLRVHIGRTQDKCQVSGDHRPRQDEDVPSDASGYRWQSPGPSLGQTLLAEGPLQCSLPTSPMNLRAWEEWFEWDGGRRDIGE